MTTKPKMTAPLAAIEVLKAEGGPLHVKVITERVLERFDTGLKGKTPAATLGAKLHIAAKKGETFRKVSPGTFELLPASEKPAESKPETPKAESETGDGHDPRATEGAVIVRQGDAKPQAKPHPKPATSGKRTARKPTTRAKAPVAA